MNPQIKVAEARCAELAKLGSKMAARCEAAARRLGDAEADEAKHAERLSAAEAAYADDPTDKNASAIGKSRDALELARLRSRKPRAEHEAALAARAAWTAEKEAAETALASAREAARMAELMQRASVVEFRRRTSADFATILDALNDLSAAAARIDQAFAEANTAAREAGERDLGAFHRVAPILRAAVAQYGASGLINQGGFYKAARASEHGLASALSISLLDAIKAHAQNAGVVPNDQAASLLERVFACRTAGEGEALIAAAEAEVRAKTDAAARKRWEEVEGPAHAREQARLSRESGGAGYLS
ncbi:MAG: hypothetical protein K0R38_4784 [Polyangiaceae bacterium]|jgi:hypothetical protein|nr:hypothetical protein [Polyangiaceae bacterium]